LLEDGLEHVEHEALPGSRQAAELLEVTLELGGGAALAGAIGQAEQGFDGHGEVLGQGGQERDRETAPTALIGGDELLRDAEPRGELGLREPLRFAALGHALPQRP